MERSECIRDVRVVNDELGANTRTRTCLLFKSTYDLFANTSTAKFTFIHATERRREGKVTNKLRVISVNWKQPISRILRSDTCSRCVCVCAFEYDLLKYVNVFFFFFRKVLFVVRIEKWGYFQFSVKYDETRRRYEYYLCAFIVEGKLFFFFFFKSLYSRIVNELKIFVLNSFWIVKCTRPRSVVCIRLIRVSSASLNNAVFVCNVHV